MSPSQKISNSQQILFESKIPIIQGYLLMDIDPYLNQYSLSKHYKWITSLELITNDEYHEKMYKKHQNHHQYEENYENKQSDTINKLNNSIRKQVDIKRINKNQENIDNGKQQQKLYRKYIQVDKLMYLVITFCQQGKLPITRIRTRSQSSSGEQNWHLLAYPSKFQHLYSNFICYQYSQTRECKRIITDLQICHQRVITSQQNNMDDWQIVTIPEMQLSNRSSSEKINLDRTTRSQSEGFYNKNCIKQSNNNYNNQKVNNNIHNSSGDIEIHIFIQDAKINNDSNNNNIAQVQQDNINNNSKLSQRSWTRQNQSNLSENSYYSYQHSQNQHQIQPQNQREIYHENQQQITNQIHSHDIEHNSHQIQHTSIRSIQKQIFSDSDKFDKIFGFRKYSNEHQKQKRNQQSQQNQHSYQDKNNKSITQFHSISQIHGPYYFLMKTIDLFDIQNQFQYVYEPKIVQSQIFQRQKQLENKKQKNKTFLTQSHLQGLVKLCLPIGIKLYKKINGCGYEIFNLILTTDQGQRYYAYFIRYRQKMNYETKKILLKELYELNLIDDVNQKNIQEKARKTIYNDKAFCLVTRKQNTDAFYKILENLYRVYQSFKDSNKGNKYFPESIFKDNVRNFQFFAKNLVENFLQFSNNHTVRKQFSPIKQFKLPLDNIPSKKSEKNQIIFKWCDLNVKFSKKEPENKVSSKALFCLLKLLSIDNIFELLKNCLLQKKIFFVSSIQITIYLSIQALLGLIHPLSVSQSIIPLISRQLIPYIHSPMPIIAGLSQQFVSKQAMTEGTYVFLDCNRVLTLNQKLLNLPNSMIESEGVLKKGYEFYDEIHVEQFLNCKEKPYFFNIHEMEEYSLQTHQHIKFILKQNILYLLKNYQLFFSNQANLEMNKTQDQRKDKKLRKHLTFKNMYDFEGFIKSHIKKQQQFYKQFTESGIFKNFIQQKYYNQYDQLIKIIDQGLFHIEQQNFINQFSCLSVNLSSKKIHRQLKQQKQKIQRDFNFEFEDNDSQKPKTKSIQQKQMKIGDRGSFTDIKNQFQTMKKNLSYQQNQSKNLAKKLNRQTIIDKNKLQNNQKCKQQSKSKKQVTQKLQQDEFYPQRYSEGGFHREKNTMKVNRNEQPIQISQQERLRLRKSTIGLKICTYFQNVTKKFNFTNKKNIDVIFNQAKVKRLKKFCKEEQMEKQKSIKENQCKIDNIKRQNKLIQIVYQQSINNLFK